MIPFPETPATQVRVFHFADVHLGVETYGKYNPETGLNTRLEDFARSLNQAVTMALEAEADIAIFAGDAYKARDPNQTHQKLFAGSLKRLTDAGVPVVLLVGNHDIPNTKGRAHALEIYGLLGGAGVTILQSPETVAVSTRKGSVLVAGMPYLTRSRVLAQEEARAKSVEEVAVLIRDRYADYIVELGREAAAHPQYLALLTGHFMLSEARLGQGTQASLLNPNEPQVPVSAVGLPVFDYVAMGHVHRYQDMHQGAQPPVVYCGSVDRIDYGERIEDKGFVLVDVRKGYAAFKHIPVRTRPFLLIEADAMNTEDPTRTIVEEIATHPIAESVVKLTYKVPADKAPLVRHDELRKALGAAHLIVSISRESSGSAALTRSEGFSENLTPEKALELYIENQPRLTARRHELLAAARPLIEALAAE